MASIVKESGGRRLISFLFQGKRQAIRLGKISQRDAGKVKGHIEALILAKENGTGTPPETAQWLASRCGPELVNKLAKHHLCEPRVSKTVGELVDAFLASSPSAKPATKFVWKQTGACLESRFGKERTIHSIRRKDAVDYHDWLVEQGYADVTCRKRLGFARQIFGYAVSHDWIPENPFKDVRHKGNEQQNWQHYLPEADAEKLIAAAPNWVWRTIIALARYGGLRTPSETLSLRLCDLDWERGAITVTSPKGEKDGKGRRIVPMFARLRPFLLEAAEQAEIGQTHVIPENLYLPASNGPNGWVNCNLRTTFEKIVKRAGLTPWPRLFHSLRGSCESDLAREYPITTVCKWIGNTVSIAARHYIQVTDLDFQQASGGTEKALQIPLQYAPENPCIPLQQETTNPGFSGVFKGFQQCTSVNVETTGIEPATPTVQG
jgi:integrase